MKELFFATTNQGKLDEATNILGLDVVGTPLEIAEIQSLDPVAVAVSKAQSYFAVLKKPIFVEDVSLAITHLNGLPGVYIDAFMKTVDNRGILNMLRGAKDRSAVAQTTICYIWSKTMYEVFVGKVKGTIANKPTGTEGFGWDPIFIPGGETRTFAQMTQEEKAKYSMRGKALGKFKKWLASR